MKFLKYILFTAIFTSFFTSCEKEVIVSLDNSAGTKVQQTIDSYISTLAEAKHGWLVDVGTNEGFYQFHMTFTDDNFVTMYTDNVYYPEYNARPKRSTYNIRSLQRITLSFDTYSYLAIINDPDNSISGGSGNQGLETDFDFEIVEFNGTTFTMTGRVNRVPARMRRATESELKAVQSGGLMNSLNNLMNYKTNQYTYFSTKDADVSAIFNGRNMDIAYFDKAGNLQEATIELHIRPNYDIELAESFEINGLNLSGFKWDATIEEYSARVGNARYDVEAGNKSVIPFYKLFGYNKKYGTMTSKLQLFDPSGANEIYRCMRDVTNSYFKASDVGISFYTSESGDPTMRFTIYLTFNNSYFPVAYDYDLKYNDDEGREGEEFTLSNMRIGYDPYGYGETLDKNLYPNSIIKYWIDKTFMVEWSTKTYNGWKTGIIYEKGKPVNEFPGVFF